MERVAEHGPPLGAPSASSRRPAGGEEDDGSDRDSYQSPALSAQELVLIQSVGQPGGDARASGSGPSTQLDESGPHDQEDLIEAEQQYQLFEARRKQQMQEVHLLEAELGEMTKERQDY